MRHMISGLVAAVAVMAAAPAMACGYTSCAPQVYAAPVVAYTSSGCNPSPNPTRRHQYHQQPTPTHPPTARPAIPVP